MADRVLPTVRLLFACDAAVCRSADEKWVLTNPRALLTLPPGASFPVNVREMWVYAQLTDGVGEFDLTVELRYVQAEEAHKVIGRGKPIRMSFPPGQQLQVFGTAFRLNKVPFRAPGMYEFGVVMIPASSPNQVVPLAGYTTLFRVLDSRDQL